MVPPGGGVALATGLIVDQNTPVAGTRMRQYPCFVGLMRWVVSYRWNHRPITGTIIQSNAL